MLYCQTLSVVGKIIPSKCSVSLSDSPIYLNLKKWTVYKITSPDKQVYVGITTDFVHRLCTYRSTYKKENSSYRRQPLSLIGTSLLKFGFNAHVFEKLEEIICDSKSIAMEREKFWILTLMSNKNLFPDGNGLNLTEGGMGFNGNHSKDSKNRMSVSHTGRIKSDNHLRNLVSAVRKSTSKKVVQYDTDMNFIKEYPSVNEAARAVYRNNINGGAISAVCQRKKKFNTACGFIFRYKEE